MPDSRNLEDMIRELTLEEKTDDAEAALNTAFRTSFAPTLIEATAGAGTKVRLYEPTGGGTFSFSMECPALAADRTITLPDANVDLTNVNTLIARLIPESAVTGTSLKLFEPTGGGASAITMECPALGGARAYTLVDRDLSFINIENTPVNCADANLTVTAALHAGRVITLDRAAGIAVTLPAATGTGNKYRFHVVTSNAGGGNYTITRAGADVINGCAAVCTDIAGVTVPAGVATTTITMNGTTTGGLPGSYVELVDVAAGMWSCQAFLYSTGVEATPFS